jgi:hypothetical protein
LVYALGKLTWFAWNEKKPSYEEFFPDDPDQPENDVDSDLEEAKAIAEELGHPTGSF